LIINSTYIGSDQIKRVRRSENLNELPKEFRKKMEQWQVKKEVAHNQEAAKGTQASCFTQLCMIY